MFRLPSIGRFAVSSAFLVLVLSALIGLMVQSEPPERASTAALQRQAPSPVDLMSAMQGNVHIDRLSAGIDKDTEAKISKAADSKLPTSLPADSRSPAFSKATRKTSDVALTLSTSALKAGAFREELHATTMRLAYHVGLKTTSAVTFLVVLLLAFVLILVACLAWPMNHSSRNSASRGQPQKDEWVLEQRERMFAHTSPILPARGGLGLGPPPSQQDLRPHSGNSLMPAPRDIGGLVSESPRPSILEQPFRESISAKPPPLCPTLVMPMSEALLGIQMYELAQLSAEGELNIVGISGKPLLRAGIKKMGSSRTLEIAMPEANSIPRATVSPSTTVMGSQLGSRALEIRGMRGAFYGILEMRSSGACYVMKDGQTVLTIDGDAESLQLSLKSSVGLRLASVRCSTELFNDVDHVEIRVEPGVDTVLVLAVVLAVLLLSPYLPHGPD